MNSSSFSDPTAGNLVPTIAGQFAFVPADLPPDLSYTDAMLEQLSAADQAIGRLQGAWTDVANPSMLAQPFINREAVMSSRIEGTQADLGDLYLFEVESGRSEGRADVQEVRNCVDAINRALVLQRSLPVGGRMLRELHSILMQGVRGQERDPGEFRRLQNWIGPAGCAIEQAKYIPPPPPQMRDSMSALDRYINEGTRPAPKLIRLALIHYQFEAIHPFIDGNGRIGRLLMTLLMNGWGVLTDPPLYLSAYFKRNRLEYYDRLHAVSTRGQWGEWVTFFLRGIAEQAVDAYNTARNLLRLRDRLMQTLHGHQASGLAIQIVDRLFDRPFVTIRGLSETLGVDYSSARYQVQKLERWGILEEITGQQRNRVYVAHEIHNILRGAGTSS